MHIANYYVRQDLRKLNNDGIHFFVKYFNVITNKGI